MTATVRLEEHDGWASLTLDNPDQRNALTPAMLDQLDSHVAGLAAAGAVRVVVLRGEGGTFSSGYAIDCFPDPADLPLEDAIETLCRRIETAPFVVVAEIEGLCVGAALDVACACDVRIGARDARLGITPAKLGLVYSWQGMNRVRQVAGREAARRLLFSAELVRADSHLGRRLVSELADDHESLEAAVAAFRSVVAANAPLSITGAKSALDALDSLARFDDERSRQHHRRRQEAMASEDGAEARAAFAERRPAHFTGR